MFRPRHAYRSPITNRYRGKVKGCPVFNNLIDINSTMVEQHDECLECLAKIKNRTDLYRTLAGNNKPSNNVIKSLQRLSSSASNNRLKTCLQFLIIKVNEKSIPTPLQPAAITKSDTASAVGTPKSIHSIEESLETTPTSPASPPRASTPQASTPQASPARATPARATPSTSARATPAPSARATPATTPDYSSSSSSCSSSSMSLSPSPSPSPLSSPDIVSELRGPRLRLSEGKIRKIKKRPVLFDDYYAEQSFSSTPTTSSGCSPGPHSNTTQNSDRIGLSMNNMVIHMFQAPPKFVNNLKPCNLPTQTNTQQPTQQPSPITSPAPTKEMLNCAICGIKDRPPNISKVYGQNSCLLCTRFFATFLKRPQQLYCAQDGDCLMTFDSRCQACWIKICLQKFDIEEHRKIGHKYSPKLLSSPNVSLITIDTSLPNHMSGRVPRA